MQSASTSTCDAPAAAADGDPSSPSAVSVPPPPHALTLLVSSSSTIDCRRKSPADESDAAAPNEPPERTFANVLSVQTPGCEFERPPVERLAAAERFAVDPGDSDVGLAALCDNSNCSGGHTVSLLNIVT